MKFLIVIKRDEAGNYVASVPEVPCVQVKAKTLEELQVRVKEAVNSYLAAEGFDPNENVELVPVKFVPVIVKESSKNKKGKSI